MINDTTIACVGLSLTSDTARPDSFTLIRSDRTHLRQQSTKTNEAEHKLETFINKYEQNYKYYKQTILILKLRTNYK